MTLITTRVSAPLHKLEAGRWNVQPVEFGPTGTVTRTNFRTCEPASEFYIAIFDRPVTREQLCDILGYDGDPRVHATWQTHSLELERAGIVISWGADSAFDRRGLQPCGYSPSSKYAGGELTGALIDDDVWTYSSTSPPWLWVCEYSPDACFIQGAFEQAVAGTAT